MDTIEQKVIVDVDVEGVQNEDLDQLAKLKSTIVASQEEAKKLKEAYKNQAITLKEYGEQASFIEAKQKKLNAAYTTTQQKVTGLKSPFDKLKESVGGNATVIDKMVPGLGSATSGLLNMAKAAIAFIATPLGATLAVVALGVAAFSAALSTNDEVADEWGVTMNQFNAVLDLQKRNLGEVGTAIDKLIHLDFKGFWEQVQIANAAYNTDLANTVKLHGRLAEEQNKLDDATNQYNLTEQATRNEIAKLILQSKNRSLSEQERIELNQKAADLEKKLTEQHVNLVQRGALLDLAAAGDTVKLYLRKGESLQQFGQRIIENSKLTEENQKKVVNAVRSIDEAESQSIKIQEKLQTQRDVLADAQIATTKKTLDEKNKLIQQQFLNELEQEKMFDEETKKQEEEKKKADQEQADAEWQTHLDEVQIHNDEMAAIAEKEFQREKDLQQARKMLAGQYTDLLLKTLNLVTVIFGKNKELALLSVLAEQGESVSKVILSTMVANAKAVEFSPATFGQPWVTINSVNAAVSIATSLAAVAAQLQGFAEGGMPEPSRVGAGRVGNQGIPIHRGNGDNRMVTMRSDEVVLTPGQQSRIGGPMALHLAGVPGFAGGGGGDFATRTAFNQSFADMSMARNISRTLNAQVPVLVLEEFDRVNNRKVQVAESARVF